MEKSGKCLIFSFYGKPMLTAGKLELVDGLLVLGGIEGFVFKDLVMLGFCVRSAGEAWASLKEEKLWKVFLSQLK